MYTKCTLRSGHERGKEGQVEGSAYTTTLSR
jgi:hypothetical protein